MGGQTLRRGHIPPACVGIVHISSVWVGWAQLVGYKWLGIGGWVQVVGCMWLGIGGGIGG